MDDIAVEAIEKNIIAKLEDILSPLKVIDTDDEEITRIAGESEESRTMRKELTAQLEVLQNGSMTCRKFIGLRMQGTHPASLIVLLVESAFRWHLTGEKQALKRH